MLLQLPVFLDANSAELKIFENPALKIKNFLLNWQIKEENLRSKLGEKPLNHDKNVGKENRVY